MKKKLLALLTAGLVACSAGLVACGHTCTYDQKVVSADTLASAATCTSPSKYYYSCECGVLGEETFTSGDALAHTFTVETVKDETLAAAATCQSPAKYFKSCSACGAVSTNEADVFTVGEVLAHNYGANGACTYGCGEVNVYAPLRTGDEANTLLFFDREIGADQVSIRNNIQYWHKYTPAYDETTGCLVLTIEKQDAVDEDHPLIASQEDECIYWDTADYQFNEGDYIVFNVYNNTASAIIDISLGNTHRQRCYNGQWTMVIWEAEDFVAEGGFSRLYERNASAAWATTKDGTTGEITSGLVGEIYFSKAKVYSSEQVKDLDQVEDTFEYTIGNTTLIGSGDNFNGTYGQNDPAFNNDAAFSHKFYVDGALRWNVNPKDSSLWPAMGFVLKEAKTVTSDLYFYVTIRNTKATDNGGLYMKAFNSAGFVASAQFGGFYGTLVERSDDGFATYKFHLGQYAGNAAATDFACFRLCADWITVAPTSTQFVVTDITIVNETPQA